MRPTPVPAGRQRQPGDPGGRPCCRLGRLPGAGEAGRFAALVDLCAELPSRTTGVAYRCVPVLDLTPPSAQACLQAAESIEELRQHGPLQVCCALGYSRSATALAAWLCLWLWPEQGHSPATGAAGHAAA